MVILLLILSMVCKNTYAQDTSSIPAKHSLSVAANTPRAGETSARIMVTYTPPGQDGENVLWDFSRSEDIQSAPVQYICSRDSSLLCIETGRKHHFELRNDSLFLSETESALYSIHYDKPLLLASYPLAYNDTIHSSYHGTGTYCKTYPLEINGTITTIVDGYGTMCLQEGDTVHNVLRLHSTRTTSLQMLENTDSILSRQMPSKQEMEEQYLWYARGYRYPLYEIVTRKWYHDAKQVTSANIAFRSNSDNLRQLDDSVNHAIQLQDSLLAVRQAEKSSIIKYTVTTSGTHTTLRYTLAKSATIQALLCDSSGFVFRRMSASGEPDIENEMDIDCTGLRRDVYILYLNVNGQVYTETISMK